jgi:hypothetical protein
MRTANYRLRHFLLLLALTPAQLPAASYGDDVAFLRQHTDVILLGQGAARVAVVPAWQGRVMTSAAHGVSGASFGWINRALISSGKLQQHINVFGGEDRFWLGPEGGQFGLYFAKGAKFDLEHWFVPPALDTKPFTLVGHSPDRALFRARFSATNWSGTTFDVSVQREVRLLSRAEAWATLDSQPSNDVSLVAYETVNTLINVGKAPWKEDTGLLSIWILGMFNPSRSATIIVPLKPVSGQDPDSGVTSGYFGSVPSDRLKVTDRAVFFSGDGQFRSKIGINPIRSTGTLGSYDADRHVLTLVLFDQPQGVARYVNSLWKVQDDPYDGDAANSYNDGPPAPGAKPLGPFYELESSSPAAALAPGASLTHTRKTLHLEGPERELDIIARKGLGVSIGEIESTLKAY